MHLLPVRSPSFGQSTWWIISTPRELEPPTWRFLDDQTYLTATAKSLSVTSYTSHWPVTLASWLEQPQQFPGKTEEEAKARLSSSDAAVNTVVSLSHYTTCNRQFDLGQVLEIAGASI